MAAVLVQMGHQVVMAVPVVMWVWVPVVRVLVRRW